MPLLPHMSVLSHHLPAVRSSSLCLGFRWGLKNVGHTQSSGLPRASWKYLPRALWVSKMLHPELCWGTRNGLAWVESQGRLGAEGRDKVIMAQLGCLI